MDGLQLWSFGAGLAFFLLAMRLVEESLKLLSGRTFKRLLYRFTGRPALSVLGGIISTAALQSSSVVTLMVLAFVGAGVMEMRNALGVVFGANLGTTFTGWIVSLLGFKLQVSALAYPLATIGGIGVLLARKETFFSRLAGFLVALGLLFVGLDLMKSGMSSLAETLPLESLRGHNLLVYFLVGLVLTALIQSSSATMMITLTALHSGIIELHAAAALVIGADLGTTITSVLASLGETAVKKQVALAHVLFNLVTDSLALLFLPFLLEGLLFVFSPEQPLFVLVGFHSLFNLLGICIFLPFLDRFASFLQRKFVNEPPSALHYLHKVDPSVSAAALTALEKECHWLIHYAIASNVLALQIEDHPEPFLKTLLEEEEFQGKSFRELYAAFKRLHGDVLEYIVVMQKEHLQEEESRRLYQLLFLCNEALHSAKAARDIHHDIEEFSQSHDRTARQYLERYQSGVKSFYARLCEFLPAEDVDTTLSDFQNLFLAAKEVYESEIQLVYMDTRESHLHEDLAPTALNINREIFSSHRSLLLALMELYLDVEEAEHFQALTQTT